MKKLTIAAIALVFFASCTKERDYLCKIETWTPRGFTGNYQSRTVNFHGTYPDMRSFEASQTWADTTHVVGDAPYGSWSECHCR